jgi:hypothetical protein
VKYLRAGLAGATAFVVANIVSNILFFRIGKSVLFENEVQSDKIKDVLFEIEPLPLMFTNGPLYMAGVAIIGILHGLVFAYIEPALPRGGRLKRGLAYGLIVWTLMAVYFEFHGPFNMFGEPFSLVLVELAFWAVVLAVEGVILSFIYGESRVIGTA